MKDFVIVIPARIGSGRLARKPLADIGGKTMIVRTFDQAAKATSPDNIYVATDSIEIINECNKYGIQSLLTSTNCLTGTDRVAEFATKVIAKCYINLQGDEPLMDPENISAMISAALKNPDLIINGWCEITNSRDYTSTTIPKVVLKEDNTLMYMSRSPIPGNKLNEFAGAKRQVCIYSFPPTALDFLRKNPTKSPVENIEDIEILRFLELGWNIKMIPLTGQSIAVDTPDDLKKVRKIYSTI